ncbi:putative type 1 membrane protein [Trifolium repens]|nr:putative type 1 membrane protein [Trifolium repens]
MEFSVSVIFTFLFFLSLLSPQARGEASGSVFFIDSSTNQFLRTRSSNDEKPSILLQEVGAAVPILLGFAPPSTLSASSSSKLNEVLIPNPFNRPRAVFLLEVNGINGFEKIVQDNVMFSKSSWDTNVVGSDKVDIQLPDEIDVSVHSLDDQLEEFTDKEISDFSSLIGGSYAADALEPLNGVLTIPLENGALVNLHMSKKAERKFVIGLLSLTRNVKRAIQIHQELSHSRLSPAELLTGSFNGIKVLQEEEEAEIIAQHGVELFLVTLTKLFGSLQEAYKGQIVGIIYCQTATPQESGKKFDVIFTPPHYHAARWLEEVNSLNTTIAEVALVRRTLAWITGIILLVSTLMGTCYLLYMPITRDTLLYSNVKLD